MCQAVKASETGPEMCQRSCTSACRPSRDFQHTIPAQATSEATTASQGGHQRANASWRPRRQPRAVQGASNKKGCLKLASFAAAASASRPPRRPGGTLVGSFTRRHAFVRCGACLRAHMGRRGSTLFLKAAYLPLARLPQRRRGEGSAAHRARSQKHAYANLRPCARPRPRRQPASRRPAARRARQTRRPRVPPRCRRPRSPRRAAAFGPRRASPSESPPRRGRGRPAAHRVAAHWRAALPTEVTPPARLQKSKIPREPPAPRRRASFKP